MQRAPKGWHCCSQRQQIGQNLPIISQFTSAWNIACSNETIYFPYLFSLFFHYTHTVLMLGCSTANFWREMKAILGWLSLKDRKLPRCRSQHMTNVLLGEKSFRYLKSVSTDWFLHCLWKDRIGNSYIYSTVPFSSPWEMINFQDVREKNKCDEMCLDVQF